jgi:hypothetical protein
MSKTSNQEHGSKWLSVPIIAQTSDYCNATDFDKSGTVEITDLAEIIAVWMQ